MTASICDGSVPNNDILRSSSLHEIPASIRTPLPWDMAKNELPLLPLLRTETKSSCIQFSKRKGL
jgi:hypothetical protein